MEKRISITTFINTHYINLMIILFKQKFIISENSEKWLKPIETRGRPQKTTGNKTNFIWRERWAKCSQNYYNKNREIVLAKKRYKNKYGNLNQFYIDYAEELKQLKIQKAEEKMEREKEKEAQAKAYEEARQKQRDEYIFKSSPKEREKNNLRNQRRWRKLHPDADPIPKKRMPMIRYV